MKNIDSDLIRGNIDTIILKTMLEEDKYGLDIIKEVEQRSNGTYELKQPTLYSCLKRLENQELISSYWLNSDIGGKRHYYKLTEKGRDFYNKKQEEWAKSKFVIDNLLSNYNYEEYRLVKKDDYDKVMSRSEELQNDDIESFEEESISNEDDYSQDYNEEIETETEQPVEFEDINESNDDFEEDFADETDELSDFPALSNDEFDGNFGEEENEGEVVDEESDDDVVYVSNNYELNEEYENDETEEDSYNQEYSAASYSLEDQTNNENNILSMLRMQRNEEINTYEGDKKSYANQIKSIYDDVKYVQDDMIIDNDDNDEYNLEQKIKDFEDASHMLNNFNSNVEDENDDEDFEDDQFEDVDESNENEYNDSIEFENDDEFEENEESVYEENSPIDFSTLDDDEVEEEFNESYEFDNEETFEDIEQEKSSASFFESTDSEDYEDVIFNEEMTQEDDGVYDNEENFDYQDDDYGDVQNDFSWNYPEDSQEQKDYSAVQHENDGQFDKDAYESTFVNVKKEVYEDVDEKPFDESSLNNYDIDSIIAKNV